MELDVHDAPRAPAGAPPARCPIRSSGPCLLRPRAMDGAARGPMRSRAPGRRLPPGWRAALPPAEPARGGVAAAPAREVPRWTWGEGSTARVRDADTHRRPAGVIFPGPDGRRRRYAVRMPTAPKKGKKDGVDPLVERLLDDDDLDDHFAAREELAAVTGD